MALPLVLLSSFSVNGNSACELLVLQGSCSYPGSLRRFCNPDCSPVPYLTCRVESNILFWWGLAGGMVRIARERSCLLVIYKIHLLTSGRKGKRKWLFCSQGVRLQTWRWEMEPCVLTEAFHPCPRKAQKPLYFPQRRPSRGGRGIKGDIKLLLCFPLTCKVLESNSGCHVILFPLST